MRCPCCKEKLVRQEYHRKILFRCSRCRGEFITIAALRGLCRSKEFVNRLWLHASHSKAPGVICPDCGRQMCQVLLFPTAETALELDVCTACRAVWFDPEELPEIPLAELEKKEDLPEKAKIILAQRQAENVGKSSPLADFCDTPDSFWKIIPPLLGLPVEKESTPLARLPLITWFLTAVCTVLFCLTEGDLETVIRVWGFIPAEWTRYGGATLISSMLLHGGWGHLLGNMYFLLTFGDNVEDEFGYLKYFLLVLFTGLSASFAHLFLHVGSPVPCVGASGFISGIIACYAVLFPRVKICFLLPRFLYLQAFINLPAWGAFMLWISFQIVMALLKPADIGGTAYSAHVGGAVAGAAAALFCRLLEKRRLCSR